MTQNFLQLNSKKTEIRLIGTDSSNTHMTNILGSYSHLITPQLRSLCVLFESNFPLNRHIKAVIQLCFLQLSKTSKIKPLLSTKNLETAVHAFISSQIDYHNSLFSVCSRKSLFPLQLIQHAAARFLTENRNARTMTPILSLILKIDHISLLKS